MPELNPPGRGPPKGAASPPRQSGSGVVGEVSQAMREPSRSMGASVVESRGTCMAHAEVSSEMAWGPEVVMKPGGEEDFESSRACKAMVEGAPVPTAMGGSQQRVSSLGDSNGRAEIPLLSTQASVPMFQGCLNPEH